MFSPNLSCTVPAPRRTSPDSTVEVAPKLVYYAPAQAVPFGQTCPEFD